MKNNAKEPIYYYDEGERVELVREERYLVMDIREAAKILTADRAEELRLAGEPLLENYMLLERKALSPDELETLQGGPALLTVCVWPNGTLHVLLNEVVITLRKRSTRLTDVLGHLAVQGVPAASRSGDGELMILPTSRRSDDTLRILRILSVDDWRDRVEAEPSMLRLVLPQTMV